MTHPLLTVGIHFLQQHWKGFFFGSRAALRPRHQPHRAVGCYRMVEGQTAERSLSYGHLAKDSMGEADALQAFQRMQGALEDSVLISKAAYAKGEQVWFTLRTRLFDELVQRSLLDHTLQAQQRQQGARPRQLQVPTHTSLHTQHTHSPPCQFLTHPLSILTRSPTHIPQYT